MRSATARASAWVPDASSPSSAAAGGLAATSSATAPSRNRSRSVQRSPDTLVSRRIGRMIEHGAPAEMSHQRLDQVELHARHVRPAVEEERARREQRGRPLEALAGAAEESGARLEPARGELGGHALGHAHERLGARAGRRARARPRLGQALERALGVRGVEARVEQVVHAGERDAEAVVEAAERARERRLFGREAPHQHGHQRLAAARARARALEQLVGERAQRLDRDARRGAAELAHEARGEVVAQAARRHHHAHGLRQQRPVGPRGVVQAPQLAEQVRFRGARATRDHDGGLGGHAGGKLPRACGRCGHAACGSWPKTASPGTHRGPTSPSPAKETR